MAESLNELAYAPDASQDNRRFLRRAVRFLATDAGIRQFVAIGAGAPAESNVHQIAQTVDPSARVLYVNDPVVTSDLQQVLVDNRTAIAINRDLRCPEEIIEHPALEALIDLEQPIAMLLVAVLHVISDDEEAYRIVDTLKSAMPTGSYLVLSHGSADETSVQIPRQLGADCEHSNVLAMSRTYTQIAGFFEGLEMLEPGLVDVRVWRPKQIPHASSHTIAYGAVARKPCTDRHETGSPRPR